MKVEDYILAIKRIEPVKFNCHFWSLRDRKSHNRTERTYPIRYDGRRKMWLCVDECMLTDPQAYCFRMAAQESTPKRLKGVVYRKPETFLEPILKN